MSTGTSRKWGHGTPAAAGVPYRLFQFTNPDVAVANRMIVVLKRKRQLLRACFVRRTDVMAGWSGGLNVVLREDAVVKDGDARWPSQFP